MARRAAGGQEKAWELGDADLAKVTGADVEVNIH